MHVCNIFIFAHIYKNWALCAYMRDIKRHVMDKKYKQWIFIFNLYLYAWIKFKWIWIIAALLWVVCDKGTDKTEIIHPILHVHDISIECCAYTGVFFRVILYCYSCFGNERFCHEIIQIKIGYILVIRGS